ncbi:MAG: hypothetical protein ACOVQ8_13330, partial [Elstera sp.]
TYATAIRADGATDGAAEGVLAIFFDWENQSQAVVDQVRLTDEERPRTRCLLIDAQHRIIAASKGSGYTLGDRYRLDIKRGDEQGAFVKADGTIVGYSLTPGYETYQGLGWYGVIEQASVIPSAHANANDHSPIWMPHAAQ